MTELWYKSYSCV